MAALSTISTLPLPVYTAPMTSLAPTTLTTSSVAAPCTVLCVCNGPPPFCPLPTPLPYTKTITVTVTRSQPPSVTGAAQLEDIDAGDVVATTSSGNIVCDCNPPPESYTGDPAACLSETVKLCNMPPITTIFATATVTVEA